MFGPAAWCSWLGMKLAISISVPGRSLKGRHRRMSILVPLMESMLGRMELLELRRLRSRWSLGLKGFRPDWRPKRFRISVKETTPVSRPEILAPGIEAAETAGKAVSDGDAGVDETKPGEWRFAELTEGVANGVPPGEGEGEDDSTIHIRCDLVASSLAIVWPRVE